MSLLSAGIFFFGVSLLVTALGVLVYFPPPDGGNFGGNCGGNCSFPASHWLWAPAKADPGGFLWGLQAGAFPVSQEKSDPPPGRVENCSDKTEKQRAPDHVCSVKIPQSSLQRQEQRSRGFSSIFCLEFAAPALLGCCGVLSPAVWDGSAWEGRNVLLKVQHSLPSNPGKAEPFLDCSGSGSRS